MKPLLPALNQYVEQRVAEFDQIPDSRKGELKQLADYIQAQRSASKPVELTFICTHNSRRSHLAQLWAKAAAIRYGIDGVNTYSGGTEVTAFNPRAVEALKRCGMEITTQNPNDANPIYQVRMTDGDVVAECFSKLFDQTPNPGNEYCAVMTCSHADQSCPTVHGCDARIAIPYEDPKQGDGTPFEAQLYDERCRQIAREMLYVFSLVETN